ncbi:MAG: right-handed parallel beta-helix repeat-containing protein [Thermoplasmata archaeon]
MGIKFVGASRLRWISAVLTAALMVTLILSMIPAAAASQPLAELQSSAGAQVLALPAGATSTSGLQAEIDQASPGATVHLPAGTFNGQLRVAKDLNLVGAGEGNTILQSPAKMVPDFLGNVFVIEVSDHASVQISKITVEVTEQCMLANSIGVATGGGVDVRGDSTLTIWDVNLVAFGPYPNLNMPCTTHGSAGMLSFGRAISIGLDDGPGIGSNVEVEGHGSIEHVSTVGFDIFSISVGGVRGPSGSTATVENNLVRVGPGPYTAAYGIVVYGVSTVSNNLVVGVPGSDGGIAVVDTSAVVTNNKVNNFICTSAPFPITPPCGVNPLTEDQDLGIFLASITPGTIVADNSIHHVDAGILVEGPAAPAAIVHNSITANTYYGLDLIDANQTFLHDVVVGGLYAIAVGAAGSNTTAILDQDTMHDYSIDLSLLEAVSPWVAKVVVEPY